MVNQPATERSQPPGMGACVSMPGAGSMSDDAYSLSDLEKMRAEMREGWQQIIRERQIRLMELIGPDVFFFCAGAPPIIEGIED